MTKSSTRQACHGWPRAAAWPLLRVLLVGPRKCQAQRRLWSAGEIDHALSLQQLQRAKKPDPAQELPCEDALGVRGMKVKVKEVEKTLGVLGKLRRGSRTRQ